MTDKEELRKEAIEDLEMVSSKARFGYFSIPATLSIGNIPVEKQRHLDENGKVVTQPRNIYTKPVQNGNSRSSYFQLEKSIFDGDLYMDPGKQQRMQSLKRSQQFADKDNFKPLNSVQKTLLSSSYVHIPQKEKERNPKQKRDADGRVVIQPRNVQGSPQSKIVESLYKQPKYMETPYEAERLQRVKDYQEGKKRMQDAPFKNTCVQKQYFTPHNEIFGLDKQLPEHTLKDSNLNIMPHDSKFKASGPCNSGALGFIGKYPQHIPDPPKQLTRKTEETKKDAFKLSAPNKIGTPCPSISFSSNSLRKYVH